MLKSTERMHFGTLVGAAKMGLRTRCSRLFEKLQIVKIKKFLGKDEYLDSRDVHNLNNDWKKK